MTRHSSLLLLGTLLIGRVALAQSSVPPSPTATPVNSGSDSDQTTAEARNVSAEAKPAESGSASATPGQVLAPPANSVALPAAGKEVPAPATSESQPAVVPVQARIEEASPAVVTENAELPVAAKRLKRTKKRNIEPSQSTDEENTTDATRDGDSPSSQGTLGRFRLMVQLRYRTSLADSAGLSTQAAIAKEQRATVQAQDGYDVQRAFLRYTSQPVKQIEAKILVDFAELRRSQVKQSFKLAYVQLHATSRLEFDVGLMKRTYSLLELLPIVDHELADLGPTDTFIKDQGYGGRDVGAVVRCQPLSKRRWLTASAGAFRGDADEGYDAHPLKLVTARVESFPWKHLRLGVNGAYRPYDSVKMNRQVVDAATNSKDYVEIVKLNSGKALGADATLLFKHFQIRAEGLYGDRTEPNRAGSNHFMAGWVVIAPSFEFGGVKLVPALKLERLDLNPAAAGGGRTVVAGVFGVVPANGLRIIVDVTRTAVDPGLTAQNQIPWTSGSHTAYAVEPSSTSGTIQLQSLF